MNQDTKTEVAFFVTGIVFMMIVGAIKYITQVPIGFMGLLIAFFFGGVVGILGISEKGGFFKNLVFIATFAWLLWAILTPIATVGDNWVIKKTELLAIITIAIIFIENDFWNIFNRMRDKPRTFNIGFLGIIALTIFLSVSGLAKQLFGWLGQHPYMIIIFFIVWFGILYFFVNKGLKRAGNMIVGKLTKGRK